MDSRPDSPASRSFLAPSLPGWARPRALSQGRASDADATFAAGIALKALDDCVRSAPIWAGCWRARQAVACAAVAVRRRGRSGDDGALRDALLLTKRGGDPGPGGRVSLAFQSLARHRGAIQTKFVTELADLLGLAWDEELAQIPTHADAACQSGRAVPLAVAELLAALHNARPDVEPLSFAIADATIALLLNWDHPVPLLMAARDGPAFRSAAPGRGATAGRGPGGGSAPREPDIARVVCLALVEGADAALRSAAAIARRAERLRAAAPKLRTKGASAVLQKLLDEDAVAASASNTGLSRWASTRLFERLESFDAVQELSGRPAFKIYGL